MERLEQVKNWLMGFPLWGEAAPGVDITGAEPGNCGLFPQGVELLQSREDVLGNRITSLRQVFLLRRTALRGDDAAGWLAAFQGCVAKNAATAPQFGLRQRFRAEKGRLIAAAPTGVGTYEVRLTAEYEHEENYNV